MIDNPRFFVQLRLLIFLSIATTCFVACEPTPEPEPEEVVLPCVPDYEVFTDRLECDENYPGHYFSITIEDDKRIILANNVPEHPIGFDGVLPVAPAPFRYEMPAEATEPQPADLQTVYHDGSKWIFGIGLNGVEFDFTWEKAWFNHCTEADDWWVFIYPGLAMDNLDCSSGVIWSGNRYRYKSFPYSYIESFGADGTEMVLIGYAADGWPIYYKYAYEDPMDATSPIVAFAAGSKLKEGEREEENCSVCGPHTGKYWLDYSFEEGPYNLGHELFRKGVTPEYPDGTWYYLMTDDFPHLSFHLNGIADPSFRKN